MSPEEILKIIQSLEGDKLQGLLDELPMILPLDALIKLGEAIASAIAANNEEDAMHAAVKAIDAETDVEEANASARR